MTKTKIISFADYINLKNDPEADLYLVKPVSSVGLNFDMKVIKFSTRHALEEFNKKANLDSVIKTKVQKGMKLYKHEIEVESNA